MKASVHGYVHPFCLGAALAAGLGLSSLAATRLEVQIAPVVRIDSDLGSTVQIQYTTDLSQAGPWISLTNLLVANSPTLFIDNTANGSPTRFYRVLVISGPPAERPLTTPADFVWISPGTFTMGSPGTEKHRQPNEGPPTEVTLTEGFWISKFLITQGQYQSVVGSNPSYFQGELQRPVESLTWDEATNYCATLTQQEQAAGRLPDGYVYRLPTEAEWEYACRAGTTTRFSYGDDPDYSRLGNHAWYGANSHESTRPVGLKLANPWGLYDMHGSVYVWCLDWYADTYPGGKATNPKGPASGTYRVQRGSGWLNSGEFSRSASRGSNLPDFRDADIGLRPVLAPAQ